MQTWALPVPLADEHVRLEPLAQAHAADLVEAAATVQGIWYTTIPTAGEVPAEIDRRLALQDAGELVAWAVVDAGTSRAVGMTTYLNIDAPNRRLEIGNTWLGRSVHGTFVNPAQKRMLLAHAFETLDAMAVEFRTHFQNRQSRAAIEKLGAKQDGILRQHKLMPNGTWRDTVVFSVLATEWPAVRAGLDARLG